MNPSPEKIMFIIAVGSGPFFEEVPLVFCWTSRMCLSDLHGGLFGALQLRPEDYTLHHLRRIVKGATKRLADLAIMPGSCVELRRVP